ncbi:MAG: TlpA family protein disulfide reductase [Bacteroidia bacterium]|nr:TlpA family protein disulfide reductase [Bacteroidia bacterium]
MLTFNKYNRYSTIIFFLLVVCLCKYSIAQIPSVVIKNTDNRSFNTSEIKNDGKPIVINFWATWCKPCLQELDAISEVYDNWQKETGVIIYAVSIDNARTTAKVSPFVDARGWDYKILLDPNSDFKRAMNVINVPHVFLLDGKGEIVYQHTTYAEGDEEAFFEQIKKVALSTNESENK